MKKYIPLVVAFALFMETLDSTIISTAIPTMAMHLHTDPISLKVALTSYLLSLAIFMPASGWFADRFGIKTVFIFALLLFTLGSLLCGLAFSLETLVMSRIVQGIGGALMMPVARLILLKTYPKSALVKMTNYVTIPALIGPALGPVVGGVIVSHVSWRWIFMVNIPFGLLGAAFAAKVLQHYDRHPVGRLDSIGFFLVGAGLAGFATAFGAIGENLVSVTTLSGMIVASLMLMVVYGVRSRYLPHPFVDLSLFKVRTFRITVLGSVWSRCGMGGIPFLLPLFFQLGLHRPPLYSGLMLLPYVIAMLIIKFKVRSVLQYLGFKKLLVLNTVLLGVSIFAFTVINQETSLYLIILLLFILGMLTSMQFSGMNVLSYADLEDKHMSQATSIVSALQQLSMSFGIAIAAILLKAWQKGAVSPAYTISLPSFHHTFLVIGLLTASAAIMFSFLNADDGRDISLAKAAAL